MRDEFYCGAEEAKEDLLFRVSEKIDFLSNPAVLAACVESGKTAGLAWMLSEIRDQLEHASRKIKSR